ncbi:MAG: S26 family signal peptidase, partial [Candidatus Levybacteria bacterium]|nr:S26 family signal peptidase [Candidatus Levybacteria bacterium]
MLLSIFKISGHSMQPSFIEGDFVIATPIPYFFYSPKAGDVVVFKVKDGKKFIKRIFKKKDESYYLIGDNRNDSKDSKDFGWIKRKAIIGKVI